MMEAYDMERERLKRLREASEWLLRLQSAKPTEEAIDEWLNWCDAHAENFNAFQRLQQGWRELDALKPHARDLRGERVRERGGRPRFRIVWALAASLGAIALAVGVFHDAWKRPASPTQEMAATQIHRAATLPDGSKMILGAQSRVNMNFDGPRRQLDLSEGEAYFKVKHDKARPFVVQAGDISVTAIGTAFDVRRERDKIVVTVEEGAVEVVSSSPLPFGEGREGSSAQAWRAEAGYQVTYSTRERSASIASVNAAAELAWRSGELAYVREALTSVVEDLNRYSTQKVVLEDAKVSEIRFTGTAFAASVEDWATGITQIYPVEVRKTASGDIVLRWRD